MQVLEDKLSDHISIYKKINHIKYIERFISKNMFQIHIIKLSNLILWKRLNTHFSQNSSKNQVKLNYNIPNLITVLYLIKFSSNIF